MEVGKIYWLNISQQVVQTENNLPVFILYDRRNFALDIPFEGDIFGEIMNAVCSYIATDMRQPRFPYIINISAAFLFPGFSHFN